MRGINIAQVLTKKRRERGITQDDLAEYIGVSKASVSKWETGQSYPDITFLPLLASYFGITIDELMSYEPQMEKADIRKLYHNYASGFATRPFPEVLAECRETIRKYHSCYPLLFHMATLLLNHHMLAESAEERTSILREAAELCDRIRTECEDAMLAKDAVSFEATCRLMLGEPQAVFALLGEETPQRTSDDALIAQAHQMLGNIQRAREVTQVGVYQNVVALAGETGTLIALSAGETEKVDESVRRLLALNEAYNLEDLHSNVMAQTYLAAAYAYCTGGCTEKALGMLEAYADLCASGRFSYTLHGDAYFDSIQSWFDECDLGGGPPRSERFIRESMLAAVESNPVFAPLNQEPRYQALLKTLRDNIGG